MSGDLFSSLDGLGGMNKHGASYKPLARVREARMFNEGWQQPKTVKTLSSGDYRYDSGSLVQTSHT